MNGIEEPSVVYGGFLCRKSEKKGGNYVNFRIERKKNEKNCITGLFKVEKKFVLFYNIKQQTSPRGRAELTRNPRDGKWIFEK